LGLNLDFIILIIFTLDLAMTHLFSLGFVLFHRFYPDHYRKLKRHKTLPEFELICLAIFKVINLIEVLYKKEIRISEIFWYLLALSHKKSLRSLLKPHYFMNYFYLWKSFHM